jgi:hypothetical protein
MVGGVGELSSDLGQGHGGAMVERRGAIVGTVGGEGGVGGDLTKVPRKECQNRLLAPVLRNFDRNRPKRTQPRRHRNSALDADSNSSLCTTSSLCTMSKP